MSAIQVGAAGGTLATAVLGAGAVAKYKAAGVGTQGTTTNRASAVAGQVVHELAHTGASSTIVLAVFAAILIIAGALFVSLARRHGPPGSEPHALSV